MNDYYVASISYGKDSLAMLITIIENKLPLDEVIFCDVLFDNNINGLHPKQVEFIKKADTIIFEKFKIKVHHIKANVTYKDQFLLKKKKGKRIGQIYGFPVLIGSWCNSKLKVDTINKYLSKLRKNYNVIQYIGIAYDEPKRIKQNKNIVYPLVEYKITENEAKEICKRNDLLSPIYSSNIKRDGCWFCNKQSLNSLRDIYYNYPMLWAELLKLDKISPYKFRPDYTVEELDNKFKKELQRGFQLSIYDFLGS